MSNKDCLFFSTQCQHSMELLKLLESHEMKQMFLLICIDNQKFKIPQFVDRVPMIYKTQERRVLVDKILVDYVSQLIAYKNQMVASRSHNSTNQQTRSRSDDPTELGGYNDISSGISDSFGFLSDQDSLQQLNTQYDYIASLENHGNQQMSQQQVRPMPTPSRDRGDPGFEPTRVEKGSRFDQQQFESLLSSRDKDIKEILQNQKQ